MTGPVTIQIPGPTINQIKGNKGRFVRSGVRRYEEFTVDETTMADATVEYDVQITRVDLPEDCNAVDARVFNARVTAFTVWSNDGHDITPHLSEIQKQELHDMVLECFCEEHSAVVCDEEAVGR